MTLKKSNRIRPFVAALLVLLICASNANFVVAQKKPTEFDSQSDDKQLCASGKALATSEYCDFWRLYNTTRRGADAASRGTAKDSRDELIKYVQGRVDRFYEESVNKKKFNRNLLQTILDVLEIGAAVAIGITNGERAKEVIGISLGGLQAMRNSVNKNFELMQTRILINKMRENRAQIMTRIVGNMDKPVSGYSWLEAKNDLRQYLYAGTFSNALDSLAGETGDAAQNAENELRVVSEDLVVVQESTIVNLGEGREAQRILIELQTNLADAATKDAALTTLKAILDKLKEDSDIAPSVEAIDLPDPDDGAAIVALIVRVRRDFNRTGKQDLARRINRTIIDVKSEQ